MTIHTVRSIVPSRHPVLPTPKQRRSRNGAAAPAGPPPAIPVPTRPSPVEEGRTDSRRFRSVLGRFATGIVAITAIDPADGRPCGLAVNSFTSVSLDPPLAGFCVAHTSTSWPRLRDARVLTVNVLSEHQRDVCDQLATKGGDKFAGLRWTCSAGGGPVLDGALAWLDCVVEAEHPAVAHLIVVARVLRLDALADDGPLVFFRGGYGRFTEPV
jgi:3-hydroxy-9,10-secoandrosta-1,3,5(10)-triene-9,17-dione monooxygenase reductase component